MLLVFFIFKVYGYFTIQDIIKIKSGLTKKKIKLISELRKENLLFKKARICSYKIWKNLSFPNWTNLEIKKIKFTKIKLFFFYLSFNFFNYINLKKLNNKFLNQFFVTKSIDIIINSNSIITTYKKQLYKQGIIFCSIYEALVLYSKLIQKYLGSTLTITDNFFAMLNSIIFSDGSFCYIPKNTICPIELSTYFTLHNKTIGQFERTLIILEKNSFLNYFEGCITQKSKKIQLHIAVVELILFDYAIIKYSTFQNWYKGSFKLDNGLYNFVTKRGICIGNKSQICWLQLELGSRITWKYPSSILLGIQSKGEFFSLSLINKKQQIDTGTKVIHIGKKTYSIILVKSTSSRYSITNNRLLIKFASNALYSRNFTQCDSLIFYFFSSIYTYPYLNFNNSICLINYEAKLLLFDTKQQFYLKQRMLNNKYIIILLFYTFFNDILIKFSKTFQLELNKMFLKVFLYDK